MKIENPTAWKDVDGYKGLYRVSDKGEVYSVRRNCIMTPRYDKDGYAQVTFKVNGRRKEYRLHRIVAAAFVHNPCCYPEVNHKDENKSNNSASNLEWCTRAYNINYGTGLSRASVNRAKPVAQYSPDGEFIQSWGSIKEASTTLSIARSDISKVAKGRQRMAGGFRWKYIK